MSWKDREDIFTKVELKTLSKKMKSSELSLRLKWISKYLEP